jgi:hypothetical protein
VPHSRHATPLCTERVHARACRHTDETLRAAVALWFDDKAAAVARYGPIGDWDTRDVTSMRGLFAGRADFDEDIGRWSVGSVEDMSCMFWDAASFNQPLDEWDVSSVKDMDNMFYFAVSFNQPLDKWDVSSVEDMGFMFQNAASFDQPLERWAVADGTDKTDMFAGATSFNQPATRKHFGLVLSSPSRALVRSQARRQTASAVSNAYDSPARAHSCSADAPRTAVLHYIARAYCTAAQTPAAGDAPAGARAHEAVDAAHTRSGPGYSQPSRSTLVPSHL